MKIATYGMGGAQCSGYLVKGVIKMLFNCSDPQFHPPHLPAHHLALCPKHVLSLRIG